MAENSLELIHFPSFTQIVIRERMAHNMVVPVLRERMQPLDLDDELSVLILGPHLVVPVREDEVAVARLSPQECCELFGHTHEAVLAVLGLAEVDLSSIEVDLVPPEPQHLGHASAGVQLGIEDGIEFSRTVGLEQSEEARDLVLG